MSEHIHELDPNELGPALSALDVPAAVNIWRDAIYAACDEVGVLVWIHIHVDGPPPILYTYSWGPAYQHLKPTPDGAVFSQRMWEAFHRACVICDPLRPRYVRPSPALEGMLQ